MPKRPSAPAGPFFIFMEDFRKRFKQGNPNNNSVAAVGKAGGVKWKSLSAYEKAPFEATAEKRKKEYEKNMNAYTKKQVCAKASGCSDLDVMKVALADYHTKTKERFGHVASWDVVKGHDKWHEQDCFQQVGGSSNSSKRKSGEYESASNGNIIPDMNEDPIPHVDSRKSNKKQVASSSSISRAAEDISSYAQRKQQYLDEKREKDKLAADLLAVQLEGAKFRNRQSEMKFFFEPHDHITDPEHLKAVFNEKRKIGRKNGWKICF